MFEKISFNEMIEDMHKSLGNNLSRKGNEAEERKNQNRYTINQVMHCL